MIQLHPDYLLFQMSDGQAIPCSAELVTVELIGDAASRLDPDLIRNIAAAVLHYFRDDLGRTSVSIAEFSEALGRVLSSLGFNVQPHGPDTEYDSSDLRFLAKASTGCFELDFFVALRARLRESLRASPELVRFHGLRDCVKQLVGAKRWCRRCENLSDQIVTYLRECLQAETASCGLVVR